jgi:hypothetical protein
MSVSAQGWIEVLAVADDRSIPWQVFFATLREHYSCYRELHIPMWLERLTTMAIGSVMRLRARPSLATPDTVLGWNLSLPVTPRLLWDEWGSNPTMRRSTLAFRRCWTSVWHFAGGIRFWIRGPIEGHQRGSALPRT